MMRARLESQHAMSLATFGGMILLDAALRGYETMLPSALSFPDQSALQFGAVSKLPRGSSRNAM